MKNSKKFPLTYYNKGFLKYYFLSVAKNIIKIAKLDRSEKIILDFGCGNKIFSKILKNNKIFNYDIQPEYSEIDSYEDLKFDLVIFNHVCMYMSPNQIDETLEKIRKKNPDCKLILSLSRQNLLSKIVMILTLKFKAHYQTVSSYEQQLKIFSEKTTLITKKEKVFGVTDIFYSKFTNG